MKLLAFSVLFIACVAQATPPAPTVPGGVEPGGSVRLFLNHDKISYYAEMTGAAETDGRNFDETQLGAYYRLFHNLKVGAFYGRAYALRHDEDWASVNGTWAWNNTNSRGEDLIIGDVTPLTALEFLPGKNWVGEFKIRYIYDAFNGQQSLILRPGIRYFWLDGDEPFLNFFFQFEALLPLNYGVQSIYEKWTYIGALYHLNDHVDLGGFTAAKWETWGSTQSYITKGGAPYAITTQTWQIGLLGVFQFSI